MSRRQRQLDQLRDLCRAGAIGRAVDLAFEHFAQFGRDDDVVALLAEVLDEAHVPERVRQQFMELRTSAP